ncbi:glycine cleavage system protein H [Alkalibacterium kapii]|uniref:Putative glycine cleavage system H protein n=1 Tax=Alkalibacterium kapii TaxID=426704 RepID=A0A511AXF4_9LACT|nr:glycine cleavage system protein H [Alkalibacterium kapii]GEK91811.1 putative glycine cleavage system H protein [Alkalibacterium kapii]
MTIKYHDNGIWIEKINDTDYKVGLSEKGQDDAGEVMFAEIVEHNGSLTKGDPILNVEGAKAVTELTLPFDAAVKETHTQIEDEPSLLNSEDKRDNWILVVNDVDPDVWNTLDTEMTLNKEESE